MVLVVAAVAATFHWTQLRELLLPITEHVRFDTAQVANFANGEIALCRDGRKGFFQLNQYATAKSSGDTPTWILREA